MSIKLRIILAFGMLFLLLMVVTLTLHSLVDSVGYAFELIGARDVPTMAVAESLQLSFLKQARAIRHFLATSDSRDLVVFHHEDDNEERLFAMAERLADSKREEAAIAQLRRVAKVHQEASADAIELLLKGDKAAAHAAQGRVDRGFDQTMVLSERLMSEARAAAEQHWRQSLPKSRQAHTISTAAPFVAAAITLVLSILVVLSITRPIGDMDKAVKRIQAGDLNARTGVRSRDELGQFATVFDSTVDRLSGVLSQLAVERERLSEANEHLGREHGKAEEELELARRVQLELLPQSRLTSNTYEVAAVFRPAGFIGGDFYRFIARGDGIRLIVGDVTGKGVPAALTMAAASALLDEAGVRERTPEAVLRRVNGLLSVRIGFRPVTFVTTLVIDWTPDTSVLSLASAGHPFPLILQKDGRTRRLSGRAALPLGAFRDVEFTADGGRLEPGERLIAFTDGLLELRNPEGNLLGEHTLAEAATVHAGLHGDKLAEAIVEWLESASTGRRDDEALVVLEAMERAA